MTLLSLAFGGLSAYVLFALIVVAAILIWFFGGKPPSGRSHCRG
jgi:hypothetical protein